MNKFVVLILSVTFTIFINNNLHSQTEEFIEPEPTKTQSDKYLLRTSGLTIPTYRDFATSPLFYVGFGINLGHGWQRVTDKIERLFELNAQAALMISQPPRSEIITPFSTGGFFSFDLNYQYLFRIPALSSDVWNTKAGGAFLMTRNIRINPSLFNAALGLESMRNLMIVGKVSRDVSRKNPVVRNYLLFKRTLPPQRREVSFQFNIGVLNFNNRPGYAYVYNSGLDGSDLGFNWVLDTYERSLNGWRFGSRLEYSKYFPNGNGRKWSYLWDIAHLPGKFEPFQMFTHRIAYTIIIHNNKR